MFKHQAFRRRPWRLLSLTLGLAASAALAQGPLDLAGIKPDLVGIKEAFQKQQQANEQALRQYSWKSRTEVRVDGEVKSTLLELVRCGADGNQEKTPIGGQAAKEPKKLREFTPAGALIGRIKRKKQEEYKTNLLKLLDAYAHIPPDPGAFWADSGSSGLPPSSPDRMGCKGPSGSSATTSSGTAIR